MQTEKVMNAYELFDNAPRKRYEFRIDGLTPMIEYAKPADGVIVLTHTEVPRELAGRGIGSRLVEKVLADIDRQGLRLIPRCSFVATTRQLIEQIERCPSGALSYRLGCGSSGR